MIYNRKVIIGAVGMTSLVTAVTIGRRRIAGWARAIANDVARRNLNVRYYTSASQIDARAELLSIMFFDKHRPYFNKRAEFYRRNVSDRGKFMLNTRAACQAVFGLLLLRELAHQHVDELRKVGSKRVAEFAALASELDREAQVLFTKMEAANIPVKMIAEEYAATS